MPTPQIRYRNPVFGYQAEDTAGDELQKKASDDPTYPSPILNYVLSWNGNEWVPAPAGGGGGGASTNDTFIVATTNADLTQQVLMSAVIQTGALASRPSASAVPAGSLYFATDSGKNCYRSDGATTWTAVNAQDAGALRAANNLSDVANAATALSNLGGLSAANNLSDLANAVTARSNLGLGNVNNTADSAKTLTGDAGGTLGATTVDKIKGSAVDGTAPTVAQLFLWDDVAAKWVPKSLSGDVTTTKAGVTTIGAAAVSYSKIQNVAAHSFLGNNTGSPASAIEMSIAAAKAELAIAEADVSGLVADLALKAPIASPTFTGTTSAPEFTATGLTGATTPVRFVGGVTGSTAPSTGTFLAGDFIITTSGRIWVCAVGGSPGVWLNAGNVSLGDILTTKGDTLWGTGTGNTARLAVGTAGQAITADATPGQGAIWANPRSGAETFLSRTGAITESLARTQLNAGIVALVSGTVFLQAVYLPKDKVISNIGWISGTTAAGTPTHWWFTLCNNARLTLRSTADQTSTAWAASTEKILPLSFTTTYEGLYYIGIMMTATTPITLQTFAGGVTTATGLAPILCGASSVGQTTPPADSTTLTAITAAVTPAYCYAS